MFFNNYEPVPAGDQDDHDSPRSPTDTTTAQQQPPPPPAPNSPPPSFHSRLSSRLSSRRPSVVHEDGDQDDDRVLDDAFAAPSDDEFDHEEDQDAAASRRLVVRSVSPEASAGPRPSIAAQQRLQADRRVTEIGMFMPGAQRGGSGQVAAGTRDGVFANLNAKPSAGQDVEEKPPSYEQAAADAAPPYWETTILAPGSFNSDDVFVDGLLVGSMFSFMWNALISTSFQLIGFLLTYLLHTTHAAKHGSRAGLGITLIQYGFTFRSDGMGPGASPFPGDQQDPPGVIPSDPNAHDFDPNQVAGNMGDPAGATGDLGTNDWISYALMIVGWFILIRSVGQFIRARRQEQMVRASPDRGLGVAVVASNETPATAV